MKILYVGVYGEGQTSKMRGDLLKKITQSQCFEVINIEIPFGQGTKVSRSIAFRYKIGPLIKKINDYIISLTGTNYDLIWVDKAIFITSFTTQYLKSRTKLLLHYTPDPAFLYHKSSHFIQSIPFYDFAVTTKTYELQYYQNKLPLRNIILTTQGYDPLIHHSYHNFESKKGVNFIGHFTSDRRSIIQNIIDNGINLTLGGIHWESLARKNKAKSNLSYIGPGVFSSEYAKSISASLFGLGLLSKIVPELHTTRTFEIPACGSLLVTENNSEINNYFDESDVLYFNNPKEIPQLIIKYQSEPLLIKSKIELASLRLSSLKVDYESLIIKILNTIHIL